MVVQSNMFSAPIMAGGSVPAVPSQVPIVVRPVVIDPSQNLIIPVNVYEDQIKKSDGKHSLRISSSNHMEELSITITLTIAPGILIDLLKQ